MSEHDVGETRSAEGRIEIDASPEEIWRALTDARELERWFPLEAEVEPGAGGWIRMSWGNEFDARSAIRVWEPPEHLRTSWEFGNGPAQVTDYLVEGEGGRTTLRVVTSGFPADASWDDMVEGTRLGWVFELRQLKHYLERHRGRPRRAAYVRRRVAASRPEAWARIEGLGDGDLGELSEVFDRTPLWQLAGITSTPPDGMLRLTVDPSREDPSSRDVSVWICGWGDVGDQVQRAGRRWGSRLAELFPEGKTLPAGS